MSKQAPGRTCLFCGGGGKMTNEHVLAQWIGEAFGIKEPQHAWHLAQGEANVDRRYRQRPFQLTAGCICKTCNNGWMADLEDAVKPLLGPMMVTGMSVALSTDEQRRLAFWAAKTVAASQGLLPPEQRIVPREHCVELLEQRRAPLRCSVAIARRPVESAAWPYRILQVGGQSRTSPPPGPRPARAGYDTYRVIFAVGHVVFHVLGYYDPDRDGELIADDLPQGFIDVCPRPRATVWPGDGEVTMAELERLTHLGRVVIARRAA